MGVMKALLPIVTCLLLSTTIGWAKTGWLEDFEKAKVKAKAENKKILLDFTGSDWCGWCMKLDEEVFSKKEFKEYAAKNLILVELDFPQGKKLSKALQKQNKDLAAQYGIRGYPTIIVLSPEGEPAGKLGYVEGGPQAFIGKLEGK